MLSAPSQAFQHYLNARAPSLFYSIPLNSISFRWKIPKKELSLGWSSPRSGIDIIADLKTNKVCGFTGEHFPGKELLQRLAAKGAGPYTAPCVVKELQQFLLEHDETLGTYYDQILIEACKATATPPGCWLKYANNTMRVPATLTRLLIGMELST
jgi:hypothetical protein